MKKLFFAAVFSSLFFPCFSQISSKALTTKTEAKDTSRKGKKPNTVPISTMANTTGSGNDQGMQSTTTVATSNTTANNNQPTNELIMKVASLEASINALNKRLPFENMAFVTIVADEKNLEGETVAHPDRYKSLRIDNPLCNGNPKAKIFAIREVRDRFSIWHIDYNPKDGYWRVFPSTISNVGISPIQILNEGQKNGYGQDVAAVIKDYDNFEDFVRQGSFLWAYPTILKRGDAVQLLIFTDLPNYNPAIYQTPGNQ